MTVHRPDPECNTNDAATATIPANFHAVNAGLIAGREKRARERAAQHAAERGGTPDQAPQTTEPSPTLRATQTLHDFALTLQDFTGTSNEPKSLPGKRPSPEETIVAAMIGSGHGAERAVFIAREFAAKYRHGIQTGTHSTDGTGFATNGEFIPEEGQARAFTFVRVLLNAPTFASCRGDGLAFVDRLAAVLGREGVAALAVKLWCQTEDLVLAVDQARTLLTENMRAVAALAMHDVEIPPRVLVHIQHYQIVLAVVKLVAALVEVNGKRDGTAFVSINDAASIIGKDRGSIWRAFDVAVRRGALERVSRGGRKHANAPGVASVYRVPWIMAK